MTTRRWSLTALTLLLVCLPISPLAGAEEAEG